MIAKDKKRYSAPELTAVVVDREIALVMMTKPIDEWPGGLAPQADQASSKSTNSERKPFGSSTPDYSKMRR